MVTRLRNINPIQCAIVSGILYALLGLIGALFFAPMMSTMTSHMPPGTLPVAAGLGVGTLLLFPILYAVLGFIGGLIMAFFYNLVARWTGGIEVTLESPFPAVSGATVATRP